MDLTAALRAFVRTVERGSITAAARDLVFHSPPSANCFATSRTMPAPACWNGRREPSARRRKGSLSMRRAERR